MPDIQLIDLTQEEERENESITLFMRKYKKLFRYLYNKYANTCYSKKIKEFDSLKDKYELITIAEIIKMLKDNKIKSSLISRDELASIMRLINLKAQRKDVLTMNYEGFQECFMQVAVCIYSKPSVSLSHLPLVDSVKALIKHFENATANRGESVVLYKDPDASALGDQELLNELNRIVKTNPDYPVPEGYRKFADKEIHFVYKIATQVTEMVPESLILCFEVLDSVINSIFVGSHSMESIVQYEIKTKVFPDIVKPHKQLMPVKYMEAIEKTKIKPKMPEKNRLNESLIVATKKKLEEPKKKLGLAIKIAIANLPKELRHNGQEVGEVLEEILESVAEGRNEINKGKNNRLINKALKDKQEFEEGLKKAEKEKEEKRKNRHMQLKQKIEGIKKKEQDESESKKKAEEEYLKKQKEKIEKEKVDRKKEYEELRKKIVEKREKKEEEKFKSMEEENKKQKENEELRIKNRKEFFKKKKLEMVINILLYKNY